MLEFVGLCVVAVVGWFFWQKKTRVSGRVRQSVSPRQEPMIADDMDGPVIKRTAPEQAELNLDPLDMSVKVDAVDVSLDVLSDTFNIEDAPEPESIPAANIMPEIESDIESEETRIADELDAALDDLQAEQAEQEALAETKSSEPHSTPESKVIAFAVMSQVGKTFSGKDVLNLFSELDLTFSADSGFYIKAKNADAENTLFTVANMVTPGSFEPTLFLAQTTPGLLLFTRILSSSADWTKFTGIVEAAEALAEGLDGVLCDEQHKVISENKMVEIQTEITDFIAQKA